MSIKVLGDDGEDRNNRPQNNYRPEYRPDKDNGYLILPIVLIMGAILICGLWLTSTPCPSMTCPNVTTSCPEVFIPEYPSCPDCNPILQCQLNNTYQNSTNTTYINMTLTSITIFNSTNYNQNSTIILGALNRTTEINTTALGLGELIIVGVNYE